MPVLQGRRIHWINIPPHLQGFSTGRKGCKDPASAAALGVSVVLTRNSRDDWMEKYLKDTQILKIKRNTHGAKLQPPEQRWKTIF